MSRILIIEDDLAIAEIERDFLEISGFSVVIARDGQEGLNQALSGKYDLILLDLMLPKIDGLEIAKRIRTQIDIPILMVTARVSESDKVRGLGLGADDYIAKPFSPTELVARVKAQLAQYKRLTKKDAKQIELVAGNIVLNTNSHKLTVGGADVELKNKEYELLHFLMVNADIVFSKEHLYERIWGMDAFGDLKTVAVHINRLRDKIEVNPQNPKHLLTVWGAGYRFTA